MKNYPEYQLSKQIAYYLKYQYPKVMFRFDMAGNNLSKAAAGKNKVLQKGKGWPDLFISEARESQKNGIYHGLFIELKAEGTRLYKKDGEPADDHIKEQLSNLLHLRTKGYAVSFGVGFDHTKKIIDDYLNCKL